MKAAAQYIDLAKKNAGVESDYKLAKVLGVDPRVISHIRHGRAFTDEMVFKIAELAGVNPAEIIAAVHAEKEKDKEKRKWWRETFEKVHGTAAAVMLAVMLAGLLPAGRVGEGQFDINPVSRSPEYVLYEYTEVANVFPVQA